MRSPVQTVGTGWNSEPEVRVTRKSLRSASSLSPVGDRFPTRGRNHPPVAARLARRSLPATTRFLPSGGPDRVPRPPKSARDTPRCPARGRNNIGLAVIVWIGPFARRPDRPSSSRRAEKPRPATLVWRCPRRATGGWTPRRFRRLPVFRAEGDLSHRRKFRLVVIGGSSVSRWGSPPESCRTQRSRLPAPARSEA